MRKPFSVFLVDPHSPKLTCWLLLMMPKKWNRYPTESLDGKEKEDTRFLCGCPKGCQILMNGSTLPHSLSDSSPLAADNRYSEYPRILVTNELVLGHLKRAKAERGTAFPVR